MPAIAAGAAVAAAINAGVTSLIAAQIIYASTFLLVSAVVAVGVSYIGNALFGAKTPKTSSSSLASDRTQMVRQAITTRKIVYGRVKVSGPITFIHVSSDNRYLYLLVTLTGHPIHGFEKVFFGDDEVELSRTAAWSAQSYAAGAYTRVGSTYYQRTSTPYPTTTSCSGYDDNGACVSWETVTTVNQSPETAPTLWSVVSDPSAIGPASFVGGDYAGYASVWTGDGTDAGDAALLAQMRADLPSMWTTDHRQRGCAKIYVKLEWNSDVYTSGVPNISAIIQGKADIYDPRTEETGYTDNWALCCADYITDPLGLEAPWEEIDEDELIASANVCDEDVTLADDTTEKRYTVNGTIDTADTTKSIIEDLITAGAGSVVWTGGLWAILAGYWRGAEAEPITESMMTGAIRVQTRRSRSDLFNAVRGTFISPDNAWQESDLPVLESDAFRDEDAGQRVYTDLALPFNTSSPSGQRLMKIALLRCRQQIAVTVPCNLRAMRYRAGDVVPLTKPNFGWDGKLFEVTNWTLAQRDNGAVGIDLSLQETAAAVWDWSASEEQTVDPAPDTNLPKPWYVAPPRNLVLASGESALLINRDNSVTLRIRAVWEESLTATVSAYEMQFKLSSAEAWTTMPDVASDTLEGFLFPVAESAAYDVRVRARNSLGVRSEWLAITGHVVVGLTEPPADVPAFRVSVVGDIATLTWGNVPSPDVSHLRLKFTPATVGATWGSSSDLMVTITGNTVQVPAMAGTYLIKAVDRGGRESINAALATNGTAAITAMNAVEDIEAAPGWAGLLTDVEVVSGTLRLAYARDVFEGADWFGVSDWFIGDDGLSASGIYEDETIIDLSEAYTSRVTATLSVGGINAASDFFAPPDVFALADWFGVDVSQFEATIQIRASMDMVEWSDWSDLTVGDVTARGIRRRLVLSSSQFGVTPVVSAFGLAVDMPDRVVGFQDIACPPEGVFVAFDPPYKGLKGLAFNDQEMQTGDRAITVSKGPEGFTRRYEDASGNPVARSFDAVATGYGRLVA